MRMESILGSLRDFSTLKFLKIAIGLSLFFIDLCRDTYPPVATWHETEPQYDFLYVNMVLRRAKEIEAFGDFIGLGFRLSYATYFRTMTLGTFWFSDNYRNLACNPNFHTSPPVSFSSPKVKIQAFKNGEGKSWFWDLLFYSLKWAIKKTSSKKNNICHMRKYFTWQVSETESQLRVGKQLFLNLCC